LVCFLFGLFQINSHGHSSTQNNEIAVSVGVTDQENNPVSRLSRDAFSVSDGKVPLEITSFQDQDAPTSIAIVFDLSGSVGGLKGAKPRQKLVSATGEVASLVDSANTSNEYFIIGFANEHKLLSQGNHSEAIAGIRRLQSLPLSGQSEFFDTCLFALDRVTLGRYAKKAVILISDGEDTYSRLGFDDIRRLLKERGVVIYALDIGDAPDSSYPSTKAGASVLDRLASDSGGLALHPRKVDDVAAAIRRIASDIGTRYLVGFRSVMNADPRKCNSFKVRVTSPIDPSRKPKTFAVRSLSSHCPSTIPASTLTLGIFKSPEEVTNVVMGTLERTQGRAKPLSS
jgi:Ca-activated chloride channel family protein